MPQNQREIPELDNSGAHWLPANYCNLRHTNEEFILDFGMTGTSPLVVQVDTSLVISPFTAKRLWMSLATLIASYEQTFGEIEIEVENRTIAPRPTPLAVGLLGPTSPTDPTDPIKQFRGPVPPGMLDRLQPIGNNALTGMCGSGTSPEPNNSLCTPAEFEDPED